MELAVRRQQVLGSAVEIQLPSGQSSLFPICFSELARIEKAFSRFLPSSELSKLNSNLGAWQSASPELLFLVQQAQQLHLSTDGHFDISLKSALDALGYDEKYSFTPKPPAPTPLLFSFFSFLTPPFRLDLANNKILLNQPIEFGGFGKGYALDKVAHLLESHGVFHYLINAGGDIYAKRGKEKTKPDEKENYPPWPVLLEHPDDPSRAIGQIELDGQSIAGSAPNRRKWGADGQYHHLLNAKTKKPAQGMKAIFVLAQSALKADAYATALFTAGFEEGIALSHKLPVEILSVSSEDKMYVSDGFDAQIFK